MRASRRTDIVVSGAWAAAFPGACVGTLWMAGVENPEHDAGLDALLDETATALRARFSGALRADLLALPELAAYASYYRRFEKTYHVLLQLESVAIKGKPLRARGALVAAMFAAELTTGLLTAGHDADRLEGPIVVDIVAPGDRYTGLGGREIEAAPGDMAMRDEAGIISSVVYGPDERTRLDEGSRAVVFATYAPPGIGREAVARHLDAIAANVRVAMPRSLVEGREIREAHLGGSR